MRLVFENTKETETEALLADTLSCFEDNQCAFLQTQVGNFCYFNHLLAANLYIDNTQFCFEEFLSHHFNLLQAPSSRGSFLRSLNAAGPAERAGKAGSMWQHPEPACPCVNGTHPPGGRVLEGGSAKGSGHTLTLRLCGSQILPRFLQFLTDTNAESLQLHFLRKLSAFCQT